MTYEEVVSTFPGGKPNGQGGVLVRCPAHDDKKPSLSISPGNGAGTLFKCHAGCDTESILTAKGWDWQDVLPPKEREAARRTTSAPCVEPFGEETRYQIRDAAGAVLAYHVREDYTDGTKTFKWQRPDGTWGLGGRKLDTMPLYGIDRLSPDAKEIVLAEGEKAADALILNGVAALGTITGAAGTPGDDALLPLLDRHVYLWPDNDDAGRKHMGRIGAALLRLGNRKVHIVNWKGAPEKGDAADLFALEGARDDFDALIDGASPFSETVPIGTPESVQTATKVKPPLFVDVSTLLDNLPQPVWYVRDFIETPSTVRFFGASGSGKSAIALDLACKTVAGGRWMDKRVTPGPVYYLSGEGRVGLLRRIKAWQKFHGMEDFPKGLHTSTARIELNTGGGLLVEQAIDKISEDTNTRPVAFIIDTLARAMPAGSHENDTKDMGEFINEVDRIRDALGCVAVIIHHTGHNEKERARGSSAALAAMDGELQVAVKGADHIAKWVKLKESKLPKDGQGFLLHSIEVDTDLTVEEGENPMITAVCAEWSGTTLGNKNAKPSPSDTFGLDTLRKACAGNGKASLKAWRAIYYREHTGDTISTKNKAFSRCRARLQEKELIEVEDDTYSLVVCSIA